MLHGVTFGRSRAAECGWTGFKCIPADAVIYSTDLTLPPGIYEAQRVPNPHGHPGDWLMIVGAAYEGYGMAERAWAQ